LKPEKYCQPSPSSINRDQKVGPIRDVAENWRKDVLVSSTFTLARHDQTEFIYIIKKERKNVVVII
jgi:hypothetical protein